MDSIDGMTEAELRAEVALKESALVRAHSDLEHLRAKLARVEELTDEWEGLRNYLRRRSPGNSRMEMLDGREANTLDVVLEKIRGALHGRERDRLRALVSDACRRAGDVEVRG